ncbi:MAG: transglutaminase family protein [Chryseolinea sp.]
MRIFLTYTMSIKVAIRHQTTYHYDRAVSLSPHTFRLKPAAHCRTPILSYSLKIQPENHFINWQQDPFGNFLARVVFNEQAKALSFEVEVIADMIVINPLDFFIEDYAETFPFAYTEQLRKELIPYFEISESGPRLKSMMAELAPKLKKLRTIDMMVLLNTTVQNKIGYTIRLEPGIQTVEESLTRLSGSCRDSGWLLVQMFRQLGLAARFVSGYLIQLKPDVQALDGPSGTAIDFTDLHAWAEVFIPGAGWIGLDPTSGLFAGEGHIPLCCTPDPASAAPISGATDKAEVTFSYKNEVERIHEDPRVTKPYTEEQWDTIITLGNKIDQDLHIGDVRLTMGGEPTFVSIDDLEAKEWNTTADGNHKRELGSQLIRRLKSSFGTGGLIHKGQGKWYPGEPLPRWLYTLVWRNDNYPIWRNDALLDLDDSKSAYTIKDVHNLGLLITKFLNVPSDHLQPALEDALFFMLEESKVPANIDPYEANLSDSLERRKLADVLNNGMATPVGYVLPIEWNFWNNKWLTCEWKFRNNRLVLIPGNSALGMRLPLQSLTYTSKSKVQLSVERDLFEELPDLERLHEKVQQRYQQPVVPSEPPREFFHTRSTPRTTDPDKNDKTKKPNENEFPEPETTFEVFTIKTALGLELREGKIYIFMPPLKYAEHYLDVLASVEAAAEKLKVKVVIEGYEPPKDNRMVKLGVSPDPGVLEVNIHPAKTWKELVNNYDILFEQARLCRLSSEKFMVDGKHTGTGGGNHITIGGITPSDSPLLRRPDLLRSLITYWQHHPGLSYLFSSQFVGPTSQAPRVDEGRPEMLYELEIAFNQIKGDKEVPFWLVDRIFRNLLIDITGNTHRAEFCIDKLYSPDSSSGRLGILEFRAFDMPPNKQMCIVQLLLLRALVARFWNKPYEAKLVRWGTLLYDKYMLPHYVSEDLKEVCADLAEEGYPFQFSWFETFFEFRFPLYGKIDVEETQLQLRLGIEPWHVLGEEATSGGTARYVDSSVERVEVKVTNFNAQRYMVTCNSIPVPLLETKVKGEYVAGVRYRAWTPPSALHPTLSKDTPLVFDIFDTWNNRSIGGCTYHVSHPGGLSYDSYPVNAYEAEGRRISRFGNEGHTQGPFTPSQPYAGIGRYLEKNEIPRKFDPPAVSINPEYPNTLDLRLY